MMTSSVLDAGRARRYLLGQLPDAESAILEDTYLSDDAAVEQIATAEDTLIEDYLAAHLSASERDQFERHYLASPGHRMRMEMVRQLTARAAVTTAAPRVQTSGASARVIWWTPWMALAASLLIIAGAAWLWLLRGTPATEMARGPQPPAATPAPGPVAAPEPTNPPATPRVFAIALMPVAVRSAGDSSVATIPAGTETVSLRLEQDVDTRRLVASRASIRTVGGAEVWRGQARDARGATATAIADVDVPVAALPADDYLVTLFGRDASGVEQDWMQYFLRIRRP